MRKVAKENEIVLAVAKAIQATFGRSEWLELGLLTGSLDYIQEHPRLLRSLDFGDDDYGGHVIEAVPVVLGRPRRTRRGIDDPRPSSATSATKFVNLAVVEKFLNLPAWLARNEPALHVALYSASDETVVDELQAAAERLGIQDIDEHAVRIRRGLRDDPAQAIGSSKELLETVLKAVLGLHGNGPETKVEIPKLLKDANVKLGLDAAGHRGNEPGAEQRRRLFSSLGQIVTATAELRNAGFGTGHGGSQRPTLDIATARLVIAAAVALTTFYVEASAAGTEEQV